MSDGDIFARLRPWSPYLFFAAAVGAFAFAVANGLRTYAGTSYPIVNEVIAPVGFMLGVLGLLGLSADLVPTGGTLARVSRWVAFVPVVTWTVLIVAGIAETAGAIPDGGVLPMAVPLVTIATMTLAFVLFGATTLRTAVYPTVAGVLMLLEAVAFVLVIGRLIPPVAIDTLHTVVYLGLGWVATTYGAARTRAEEPAGDATDTTDSPDTADSTA